MIITFEFIFHWANSKFFFTKDIFVNVLAFEHYVWCWIHVMLMKMITKYIHVVSHISFGIQNFSLFESKKFQYHNCLIFAPILFLPTLILKPQREDWRLRPLTPEMIEYARTDAHYLLYIANCLASELHAKACGMF